MLMKSYILLIVIALSYILTFTSCSPVYIPNVAPTPMLSEKGDAKLDLNYGVSGFDPQLAYAVTDHLGILVNASFADTDGSRDSGYYHRHNFIELGAGYFNKIGEKGLFSIYGGVGFGDISSSYSSGIINNPDLDTRQFRFFIQPSLGIKTDVYEGAIGARFVSLQLLDLNQGSVNYFLEPTITNKLGFKYGKVCLQTGFAVPIMGSNFGYDYHPLMFSFGVELDIGKIIKSPK